MESEKCQRCHQDIYGQWSSSAHRFSSFNNQWYRKSIEYMQEVVGTTPSKWCGGCHDPAVLYTGLMDLPLKDIIDREESHVGLGCVMCHSISVESTMGLAGFTVDYPPLYQLATSENPIVQAVHDFVVKLNPEAHRRSFMKPPLRDQASEFCSSCHKVHLDVPVNNYRWIRGIQRLRQLAGQWSLRARRAFVLLPGDPSNVHRLSHARDAVLRHGERRWHGPLPPLSGGEHSLAHSESGTRLSWIRLLSFSRMTLSALTSLESLRPDLSTPQLWVSQPVTSRRPSRSERKPPRALSA